MANYNHGLAGYAGSCERMRGQLAKLEHEQNQLRARVAARLAAADRAGAGRCALRLEQVAQQLTALRGQLAETETTYSELLRARELMVSAARDKLGALKRSIRELETQQALAGLSELSAGMQNSFDGSGATLERLLEQVEERRTLAVGRARVAREGLELGARASSRPNGRCWLNRPCDGLKLTAAGMPCRHFPASQRHEYSRFECESGSHRPAHAGLVRLSA